MNSETTKHKRLKRLKNMLVLVTTHYQQAIEILLLMLLTIPSFSLSSNKIYIINVNFTESTRAIFKLLFFNLILKSIKFSISLELSGSMSHVLGPRNETLSLPWYIDFTNGLENSVICLRLYRLLSYCSLSFYL